MTQKRELFTFVARVIALILILALVWPLLAPAYGRLVAAGASALLGEAITVWVDGRGNLQADKEWRGRWGRPLREASPQGVRGSWEGLLLVTSLLLATPNLGWRRRAVVLGVGWASMSLFYAVYVFAFFQSFLSPADRLYVWFPFSEVWVPLVVWFALTFRRWLPARADATAR